MAAEARIVADRLAHKCAGRPGPTKAALPVSLMRPHDLVYVVACCEHWARMAFSTGYDSVSSTGKLIGGNSTNCRCRGKDAQCSLCDGTGRVSGDLRPEHYSRPAICEQCDRDEDGNPTGDFAGRTCFKCRGRKWRFVTVEKVNPASIKSTKYIGGKGVDDRIYHVIEETVRSWKHHDSTVWLRKVIIRQYLWIGTQEMKAAALRVSQAFFSKKLKEAHAELERILRHE
jgi:hypothetical protein